MLTGVSLRRVSLMPKSPQGRARRTGPNGREKWCERAPGRPVRAGGAVRGERGAGSGASVREGARTGRGQAGNGRLEIPLRR
ncbi:hypothetical protein GCM10025734_65160 [Kitasatospora paranensis]